MRTGAILWAGFDPGERSLVARATLEPSKVAPALPLRVRVHGDTVALENQTRITVGTFGAEAPTAPLVSYLARLRGDVAQGRVPPQVTVPLSSVPVDQRITVAAPLHVTGTIGRERIDLLLKSTARIHGTGRIDLKVDPMELVDDVTATGGRALLQAAIRATLIVGARTSTRSSSGTPIRPARTAPSTRTAPRAHHTRRRSPGDSPQAILDHDGAGRRCDRRRAGRRRSALG